MDTDKEHVLVIIDNSGRKIYSLPDYRKGQFSAAVKSIKENLTHLGVSAWVEEYEPDKHN